MGFDIYNIHQDGLTENNKHEIGLNLEKKVVSAVE